MRVYSSASEVCSIVPNVPFTKLTLSKSGKLDLSGDLELDEKLIREQLASIVTLTDYTWNCYSNMFIIFMHGIRVGPYCTAWCGLNIWERI